MKKEELMERIKKIVQKTNPYAISVSENEKFADICFLQKENTEYIVVSGIPIPVQSIEYVQYDTDGTILFRLEGNNTFGYSAADEEDDEDEEFTFIDEVSRRHFGDDAVFELQKYLDGLAFQEQLMDQLFYAIFDLDESNQNKEQMIIQIEMAALRYINENPGMNKTKFIMVTIELSRFLMNRDVEGVPFMISVALIRDFMRNGILSEYFQFLFQKGELFIGFECTDSVFFEVLHIVNTVNQTEDDVDTGGEFIDEDYD